LREPNSVGGKSIEIGCSNFTAVTAKVGKAHVIGEDDNDVGPLKWCAEEAGRTERKTNEERKYFHEQGQKLILRRDKTQHDDRRLRARLLANTGLSRVH
jgi:hypothetical protein